MVQLSNLIRNLPPYHFGDAKKRIAERKAAGIDVINLSMGAPDLPHHNQWLTVYALPCRLLRITAIPNILACVPYMQHSQPGSNSASTFASPPNAICCRCSVQKRGLPT